jgi:predicted ATPase
MSVTRLSLKDFSAFHEAEFTFSPGLNVLIGANATGKSHVMKLIYSVLKMKAAGANHVEPEATTPVLTAVKLQEKLQRVFQPDAKRIGRLVRRRRGRNHAEAALEWDGSEFSFILSTLDKLTVKRDTLPPITSCLFMPTRELLSMYPGFIAAYEGRELEFDDTYYDLSLALSATALRGPRLGSATELLAPLEKAVLRSVVLKGGRFYLKSRGEGRLEVPLVAEGFRKIGSLMHLITNGSLAKAGVLFWDEPETNLNPKLITVIASLLLKLAGAGVQLFIATHDYLLTNELSVAAEYATPEGRAAKPRFFCLGRSKPREPVTIQSGDTVADLGTNPILEEFAAHYDRQQKLFAQVKPSED